MPGGSYAKPGNWATLKRRVLVRDDWTCFCGRHAITADHRIGVAEWAARRLPGSPHTMDNLRAICEVCHDEKSKLEAAEGRRRGARARKAHMRRQAEAHPGGISPGA